MGSDHNILLQILFLAFLTLVNAFFSSAEMAVVSVNKNKIKILTEEGNSNAKLVEKLMEDSTSFLSTIQVAITFAGYFQSASAATGIAKLLGKYLATLNFPYYDTFSILIVTFILSYITLVFGELVPKRIALQKAEKISLFVVKPVYYVSKLLSPFIKFLSLSTNLVLRAFGMTYENLEEDVSEEEIKALVETASEKGVFNDIEKDMINSIFSFDDITAKDIMVSRKDTYKIDINEPLENYIDEMIDTYYSRIPVYRDEIDNIIGVLYIKDLFSEVRKVGFSNVNIEPILQPPYFVPEMKNIDSLFKDMQKTRTHIAILIDEYGGFSGIVTIEDLVEQVMGEINDEYDDEENDIVKISDYNYYLKGTAEIRELNKIANISIDNENYDTISGFLIEKLGYVPKINEHPTVKIDNLIFKIESSNDNRIEKATLLVDRSESDNKSE